MKCQYENCIREDDSNKRFFRIYRLKDGVKKFGYYCDEHEKMIARENIRRLRDG